VSKGKSFEEICLAQVARWEGRKSSQRARKECDVTAQEWTLLKRGHLEGKEPKETSSMAVCSRDAGDYKAPRFINLVWG